MRSKAFSLLLLLSLAANAEEVIPNDPLFDQQWGLHNPYSRYDIGATKAWALESGNKKIAIVMLDTGIDYNHPDLLHNLWINPKEIPGNKIDDDHNGYIDDIHGINTITGSGDPMDDNGHGTAIAGIIGAEANNNIGIAGIMHNVSLISCKFLSAQGTGLAEDALECMNYVANLVAQYPEINIVATNNAWGGGSFSQAMLDAINRHKDLGILFVTTSGSSSMSLDDQEFYPARYDAANIIVSARADEQGKLAWSTSFGPNSVHLAAPGENIWTTARGGGYASLSGTMNTAFVSGIIGLIKSQNNKLTWGQVKHRLLTNTKALATTEDESKVISGGFSRALESLSH